MQFDVTAVVSNLQCTTPTDPGGEDEPYLWVFFAKLDGSTIRQRAAPAVNRLSASVEVHAGPGGHGNLGSSSAVSGSAIQVPPAVGRHETSLRPIPINIYGGTQTVRVFVPGSLLAFALVIEEDAVPAEAPIAELAFTGQIIELSDQLLERYVECTARHLQSLHVRVKPSIPAQWRTPEVRWQRFESALERISELQRSGLVDQATVARLKPRIARKFGLG
jgi:hypothetical protein